MTHSRTHRSRTEVWTYRSSRKWPVQGFLTTLLTWHIWKLKLPPLNYFLILIVYPVFRCFLGSVRIRTITILQLSNSFYFVYYLRSSFKLGWLVWKFSAINILAHLPPAAQLVQAYGMKTNFKTSKGRWKASFCWQRRKGGVEKEGKKEVTALIACWYSSDIWRALFFRKTAN